MSKIWATTAGRPYTSSVLPSLPRSWSWSTPCTCTYIPSYVKHALLNTSQLCEDLQVKDHCPRCCSFSPTVSGVANHRPHSLPVQWLPLRYSDTVHGSGAQQFYTFAVRSAFRCPPMPQAHLFISRTRVFCLSSTRLLLGATVDLPLLQHPVI